MTFNSQSMKLTTIYLTELHEERIERYAGRENNRFAKRNSRKNSWNEKKNETESWKHRPSYTKKRKVVQLLEGRICNIW